MKLIKGNILVVEDDLNLSFLLMELLQNEGFRVRIAKNGLDGIQLLQKETFDLCILDVSMPKLDGFNLAKYINKDYPNTPFLFLTARILKDDRLKGYNLGAEDYITKPFDEEELLCKINVILRRLQSDDPQKIAQFYQLGKYTFRRDKMELKSKSKTFRLTDIESKVLTLLCQHQNRILRRDDALHKIYGKTDYFLGRSFDVYISKLRKKLSDEKNVSIENVFKVGFIMNVHSDVE